MVKEEFRFCNDPRQAEDVYASWYYAIIESGGTRTDVLPSRDLGSQKLRKVIQIVT